jgi:predicted ATPase
VTFLFTDIEGSTRLLHELGDAYADALAEHRRVLRDAFARHGGVEVDTQGDAFFVAFARATDALAAAAEGQQGLDGAVRVRMGVHTGEPLVTDDGYVGIDVHRAARIAAVGHGGQVLVSPSTRELVGAGSLRDLGEHRLKDLTAPERIWQLGNRDFPPLKSLNATNLPVAANPLVGRERELEEIVGLLTGSTRLVTVTGTGGTGKTRLALQAAAEVVDAFSGGVFFVPLAGVQRPELVSSSIASTIGVHELDELRDREALLVLDNFEHLLDAVSTVAEILARGTRTKVLATSRAPLRVGGEREYPLDPLPDDDAVTLLTERARAIRPDFVPDAATAEICRRLDGLPLALELAAPRLRSLGSGALLERLDRRLPVLTSGRRDAPERQRTLRAAIEWSYDLLEARLQQLFARLGVFATFTLDAAEAVAGAGLDDVDAVVEASLLKPLQGDRFLMLETIREFALERLSESGEEDTVRLAHAEFFARLAASANLHTESAGPMRHDLVVPELNNIRGALTWAIAARRQNEGLRLAGHLENFWMTSDAAEGAQWIQTLLDLAADPDPELHALALRCLGNSATVSGNPAGEDYYLQSLDRWRALGRDAEVTSLLHRVAVWAVNHGDEERALRLLDEGEALNATAGLGKIEASNLSLRGDLERQAGRLESALSYYDRSLVKARETGFTWWELHLLSGTALTLFELGRPDAAIERARDALVLAQRIGDRPGLVDAVVLVARGYAEHGEVGRAGMLLGAAEAEVGRAPVAGWRDDDELLVVPLLAHSGREFDAGREAGRELSFAEAVALARG